MYNHCEPCETSVSPDLSPFHDQQVHSQGTEKPSQSPLGTVYSHQHWAIHYPWVSLSVGYGLQRSPVMNNSKVQCDARKWEFHEEHHILSGLLWNVEYWQHWLFPVLVFMRDPYCWLHTLLHKLNRKSCPSRFSCPFSNTAHFKSCNIPLSRVSVAEHYGCSEEDRSPTTSEELQNKLVQGRGNKRKFHCWTIPSVYS